MVCNERRWFIDGGAHERSARADMLELLEVISWQVKDLSR
jgi:hypothetical protein